MPDGLSPSKQTLTPDLLKDFSRVRGDSLELAKGLSDADATVQSMEDASPSKWHLAHVTWFFERFILREHLSGYTPFSDDFDYLFNSYYDAVGDRHPRPRRGMLTRPRLDEVLAYRAHVDAGMETLLSGELNKELAGLVTLGLHHEQQHQELFLTDLLHLFAHNPLKPAFRPPELRLMKGDAAELSWQRFEGGLVEIGHEGEGFFFDCEGPRHKVWLEPFELANRAVTNGEWMSFVSDGGYERPDHWLSDGWATCQAEGWQAPLYWRFEDGEWWTMTLRGWQPVDPKAPVCHVSQYEADAYASWVGARLPDEAEWEVAAHDVPPDGNDVGTGRLSPAPQSGDGLLGLFGDVWEWTRSAYAPYPGFKAAEGAVGEYNGKFMSGQYVLRGGACSTPPGHIRATYRNFFHPGKRWQFAGLRLARDA
ncbi:MAG: ergothioneine biosynthesis protein EgtB [Henriciella sp.]|uniref:ergothioneine biosynthesis protein EgtB n=1 Tax=Henriciella sp. TaxID=1968823 RepID=UPI0032EDC160